MLVCRFTLIECTEAPCTMVNPYIGSSVVPKISSGGALGASVNSAKLYKISYFGTDFSHSVPQTLIAPLNMILDTLVKIPLT